MMPRTEADALIDAVAADPHRAAVAIVRALTVAGAVTEWDSGTVENVLTEVWAALPTRQPVTFDGSTPELRYWDGVAADLGIDWVRPDEDDLVLDDDMRDERWSPLAGGFTAGRDDDDSTASGVTR